MGGNAQSIPNHTIDPATGFVESNAYVYAFDATKKKIFLERYKLNGLSLYDTCDELGLTHKTVLKHYREDAAFAAAFDEAEREYYDRLEGKSRRNAFNDKSVIERLFQLNSGSRKGLTRGKYIDDKTTTGSIHVTMNFDGKSVEFVKKREEVIEVGEITSAPDLATESTGSSATPAAANISSAPAVE